jgi:hypothetical protein
VLISSTLAVYIPGEAKWGLQGRLRGSRSLIFSLDDLASKKWTGIWL